MGNDIYDYDATLSGNAQEFERHAVVREFHTPLPDDEAAKLCKLFSEGLESGLGYERLLTFMERQKFAKRVVTRLRGAIQDGYRLGEAFAVIGLLDASARKLILVAEEQGALPETFRELSQVYEANYKRKKQVFYGMVEVFIMTVLGGIVFPTVFITGMNAEGDVQAAIFKALGVGILQSVIALSIVGVIFYYWINQAVDSPIRNATHGIWIRLPFVSQASRLYSVAQFCGYFRQSISSGMDIFRSVALAAEASDNPRIYGHVHKTEQAIEAGYSLDDALSLIPGLPDDVVEYIGIGEETGQLEDQLRQQAAKYSELSEEAFERLIATVVYITRLMLIVGVIGGALYLITSSVNFG